MPPGMKKECQNVWVGGAECVYMYTCQLIRRPQNGVQTGTPVVAQRRGQAEHWLTHM